jgi:hypothetical protein
MEKKIYTQEQIDEAILVLEIVASNPLYHGDSGGAARAIGADNELAWQSWDALCGADLVSSHECRVYLEAAALLRDGWRPGDKLYLIGKE